MASTTSNSTDLSAGGFQFHRLCPSGGRRTRQGDRPGLGPPVEYPLTAQLARILADDGRSNPSLTNRWRTRSAAATLTSSASAIR
jgi:hypothetical protein